MNPKKSVYIAVLNQGEIRVDLVRWMMKVDRHSDYEVAFEMPSEKPIANNRNQIVDRFLDTDYDYLMMIDDDIVPPHNAMELVDQDVDIITPLMFAHRVVQDGGIGLVPLILERTDYPPEPDDEMTYLKKALNIPAIVEEEEKINYNIKGVKEGKNYAHSGLVECDATGTGAMIIKREVLEDMNAPFLDVFSEDVGDRTLGLDINFCYRAKKKGYRVFVHTDYIASHWTTMNQKSVYESLNDTGLGVTKVGKR